MTPDVPPQSYFDPICFDCPEVRVSWDPIKSVASLV